MPQTNDSDTRCRCCGRSIPLVQPRDQLDALAQLRGYCCAECYLHAEGRQARCITYVHGVVPVTVGDLPVPGARRGVLL